MIYDLLYFISITLSILVAIFLYFRLKPKFYNLHIHTLAAYLFLNALCFSFYLIIKYEYILAFPYLYKTAAPITYLVVLCSYFHVYFIVNKETKFKAKHILHLIPFVLFLVSYMPFFFMDYSLKLEYINTVIANPNIMHIDNVGLLPENLNNLGRIVQPVLYIILQWVLLFSPKGKTLKSKEDILYKWLLNFVRLQSLFFIALLATVFTSSRFYPIFENSFFINLPLTFTVSFFFILSFYLFWNPNILNKLKYYNPNSSTENESLETTNSIAELVYKEKYFIGTENDINGIAKSIGLSKNELSKIINKDNSSFSSWINEIKIKYAIELIKENYLESYSVDALSSACGFNSKNTFYRAFKTQTGCTPKDYVATKEV